MSVAPGGSPLPGSRSHRTSPVTSYVPVVQPPPELHVVQIPPPVVEPFDPGPPPGATKVPAPIIAIVEPSCAAAVAVPPADTVGGGVAMSQRTCSAWANAEVAVAAT